jgi:hypothetical protein
MANDTSQDWRSPIEEYIRAKFPPDDVDRAITILRAEETKQALEIIVRNLKIEDDGVLYAILRSCAELSFPLGERTLTRDLAASAKDAARLLGRLLAERIGTSGDSVATMLRQTHSRQDVPADADILAALSAVADYFGVFTGRGRKFPDLRQHALLIRLAAILSTYTVSKNTDWIYPALRLLMRATFGAEWKSTDLSTRKRLEKIKRDNPEVAKKAKERYSIRNK